MRNLVESFEKVNLLSKVKEKDFEKFYINFKQFKEFIIKVRYKKITNKDEISEENIKNKAKTLLFDYFKYKMSLGSLDLAIYDDNQEKVLFEFKSIDNTNEMIAINDLSKKALWQLVAGALENYKANNRIVTPNFFITTNGIEWFIFDKRTIVSYFVGKEEFTQYVEGGLFTPQKKEELYSAIKDYIQQYRLQDKINYDYINILDSSIDEKKIAKAFYIFASPAFMFNKVNINANNILNSDFYKELLYIMGLEEKDRKIVPLDLNGSFYNQIARKLPKKDDIESALDLLIIWFNRILFLKLFEARLFLFNDNNNDYKFLNINRIPDFASLNNLFFEVLAIPVDKRSNDRFVNIPYLNSSLFEKQEKMEISSMANDDIEYYSNTVLRNNDKKAGKRTGKAKLLEYLFEFLDAYNFGMVLDNKEVDLISPSVLGLIFEKINGYKDGSYYTQTEITDYMAKESIENIIISKVNSALSKQYSSFESFENDFFERYDEKDKKTVKRIIDELTVCDPAVGSGHFLVSALNILIFIKWQLFGFGDTSLKQYYDIRLENNDIVYIDKDLQEEFIYRRPNKDTPGQQFQKAIFEAKKYIIEHNLFGVDINPKSVEIARLRLWIELLKNAYYTEESQFMKMETLPNIDINIKVGDSLLAPILNDNSSLFTIIDLQQYKLWFNEYQNESDKKGRDDIKEKMQSFREGFIKRAGVGINYDKLIWSLDFPQTLDDNGKFMGFDVMIANPPYGVKYLDKHKRSYINGKYKCTKTITGIQKGSKDSYALFIEQGINLLIDDGGILIYIVPMSVISSDAMAALHNFLKSKCKIMSVSSYAVRPQPVFESAVVNTSIIELMKGKSPSFQVFTTKMYRKSNKHLLEDIIRSLKFIDVTKFYKNSRYPKISEPVEINILEKVLNQKYEIKDIRKEKGTPVYYRFAGGRYFKVVTPYSTNSSAERPLYLEERIAKSIGAIMSSNLFFWFYQIYSDNLNLKLSDTDSFGIPYNKLTDNVIKQIEEAYEEYLADIEKNAIIHKDTSYTNIDSFKEYKIGKSKHLADKIDDIFGPLYGLTNDEIKFIKNYEVEFRISED